MSTYDVKVWDPRKIGDTAKGRWRVRWAVAGREHCKSFAAKPLADGFAAGLIYGLITGAGLSMALAYGTAHGALAMTTPGDTSMATRAEVEAVMRGRTARIAR